MTLHHPGHVSPVHARLRAASVAGRPGGPVPFTSLFAPRSPCRRLGAVAALAQAGAASQTALPVNTLRGAARDGSVRVSDLNEALSQFRAGEPTCEGEGWEAVVTRSGAGRVWRVVYTENAVADNAFKLQSQTKAKEGAPGTYFPGTMINSFQPDSATFVMGVYSGHWLHLKMTGPYQFNGNKISFSLEKAEVALGPLKFTIPVNFKGPSEGESNGYTYLYGNDDILVAKSARGGIALLARATPEWQLRNGIL